MLAVVKDYTKKGVSLQEILQPELSPYEVIIKVRAVGICGSDIRIYNEVIHRRKKLSSGTSFRVRLWILGKRSTALRKEIEWPLKFA